MNLGRGSRIFILARVSRALWAPHRALDACRTRRGAVNPRSLPTFSVVTLASDRNQRRPTFDGHKCARGTAIVRLMTSGVAARDETTLDRALLPLTLGTFVPGPIAGSPSDRFGERGFASVGVLVFGGSFVSFMLVPVDFPYWIFALLHRQRDRRGHVRCAELIVDRGQGCRATPRCRLRDACHVLELGHCAPHWRVLLDHDHRTGEHSAPSTDQWADPTRRGVRRRSPSRGTPARPSRHCSRRCSASMPYVTFSPVALPPRSRALLTGREFFPTLVAALIHDGLRVVFLAAAELLVPAAAVSLLRGGRLAALVQDEHASTRDSRG